MVQFNKDSYTITVETGFNPAENWLQTLDELLEILQCLNPEMVGDKVYYYAFDLIRNMLPDIETAMKMAE